MLLKEEEKTRLLTEIHEYIDKNCIFRCDPNVVYSEGLEPGKIYGQQPGIRNTSLFFLRRLMHDNKMLTYVSAIILDDMMRKYDSGKDRFFQLCGMESSSIPLMIGIQAQAARYGIGMNSFSIRKSRKHYGLFNLIDGKPTEAPVVVVDDLINSGSSIAYCLDTVKHELDLSPASTVYSIIKVNPNMSHLKWNEHTMEVFSLFDMSRFSMNYSPEKYWLPKDCDRSVNKRKDYK